MHSHATLGITRITEAAQGPRVALGVAAFLSKLQRKYVLRVAFGGPALGEIEVALRVMDARAFDGQFKPFGDWLRLAQCQHGRAKSPVIR